VLELYLRILWNNFVCHARVSHFVFVDYGFCVVKVHKTWLLIWSRSTSITSLLFGCVTMRKWMELTANVDLQLTEVCNFIRRRKLYDEVSVRQHISCTLQGDCSPGSYGSRVLTTDSVVPQGRSRYGGWNIGQTDDEIVGSLVCEQKQQSNFDILTNALPQKDKSVVLLTLNGKMSCLKTGK